MEFLKRWFPIWALRREIARSQLGRLYEAASTTNYRPRRGSGASADAVVQNASNRLREFGRYLDENHDLALGVLDDLVANIVGTGVGVEPMVTNLQGEPVQAVNDQLRDLWAEFWRRPEVTQEIPGPELERMICRAWLRDGEVFIQHVVKDLAPYPTGLRYALEAIEADLVPFDYEENGARQGVQKDAWGAVVGYYVYKTHPGDAFGLLGSRGKYPEVKFVRREQMSHIKLARRLHQTRGVSVFHAVLTRLDDLKDYESSEQIAARVAADWVGYIKRSADFTGAAAAASGERTFNMAPGMIFKDLLPGEDVGVIKSDRPNTALPEFRKAMLKAVAAGTHTRYSSIAKSYDGTFSAQRQELIEGAIHYRMLFSYLAEQFYLPVWQRFVDAAVLGGLVRIPLAIKQLSLYRPELRPPQLGWIDPLKEAQAAALCIAQGLKARHQVIRDMGGDPRTVDQQLAADEFDVRPDESPETPAEDQQDSSEGDAADTAEDAA